MKLRNKLIYAIVAIMILGTTSSCRKWLQVYSDDRIMENNLFKNQDGFLVALNGIYIDLISSSLYNGTLSVGSFDVLAQYWATNDTKHSSNKLATFDEAMTKSLSSSVWSKCYPLLTNINTLLEHCESDKNMLTPGTYAIVKGEALALRALLHFEMFRIFGPICSTDDMSVMTMPYANSSALLVRPLLSASEIVAKINADLLESEKLLKESDPVITAGIDFIEKDEESNELKFRNLRLNYFAVKALTARVALYTNDKAKAFAYASEVIKETTEDNKFFPFIPKNYAEQVGYEDKVYSSEIIFGIYNTKMHTDIHDGYFSRNNEDTKVLSMPGSAIAALYDGFDGDIRKMHQWGDGLNPSLESRTYFIKYERAKFTTEDFNSANNPNKVRHPSYLSVIRISEMFLIIAECKYDTEPLVALGAINKIRYARNAPNITDNGALFTAIQYEIAREFIGEGQLFWFYKRNNVKSIPQLAYPKSSITVDSKNYYFVIPQNEIDARK